ncbi:MAG: hypothetical protein COT71_01025, partial [Candidatus Andersenbacteria bacterium CG10_big_fil_rev_8_21_14_0_10_54_11]
IPAPVISLSAASLAFGNVEKDQSEQKTFRIKNTGSAALSVTTISTAAPFSVSPVGPLTVNAGDSATVTVTFAPTATGSASGAITVTHNASGSPKTISLSGAGTDAPPAAPTNLTAKPGNNQVTLSWTANTESDLSHYVIYRSSTASALGDSVGRANKPNMTFTDASLGAGGYYYRIKAVDTAGNKSAQSNQASATLAAVISLSDSTLAFGSVSVDSSITWMFTVFNTGNGTLTVSSITASGTDAGQFAVSPTSVTIAAGGAPQTVTVTFTPTASGGKTATLTLTHNASGHSSTVTASGTGTQAGINLSANSLNFGSVEVNKTKQRTFVVSNTGNAALTVSNITSSSGFTVSPTSFTIAAGEDTVIVTVTFAPTAVGTQSGGLLIAHNAPNSPATIALNGTGTAQQPPKEPVFRSSPAALDFGNARVGRPAELTLTVSNDGDTTLTVTKVSSDLAVFKASPDSFNIQAGQSQAIKVTFTPADTGAVVGALTVAHNAETGINTIPVSGRGVRPILALLPSLLEFKSVSIDTAKTLTLTVMNKGNADLRIENITSSNPSFTVSVASFVVGPGSSQPVAITFRPRVEGEQTTSLAIAHNDTITGSPTTVALTGQGVAVSAPTLNPDPLAFGKIKVGRSASLALTITNTDTLAAVEVTGIALSDTTFKAFPTQFTVPAGSRATTNVTFAPPDRTPRAAALTLTYNAGTGTATATATLTGQGIQPVITVSTLRLDFDTVSVGEAAHLPLTISNTGNDTLLVNSIRISGPDSAQFPLITKQAVPLYTILPDGRDIVSVPFLPMSAGGKSATLTLVHNAPDSASLITLIGMGRLKAGVVSLLATPDSVASDSVFVISVNLSETAQVAAGDVTLSFPDSIFTIVSLTRGPLIAGDEMVFASNDSVPGQVKVALASVTALGEGTLFTMTCAVAVNASTGLYPLQLVEAGFFNAAGDSLSLAMVDDTLAVYSEEPVVSSDVLILLDMDITPGNQNLDSLGATVGDTVLVQIFIERAPATTGYSIHFGLDPAMIDAEGVAFSPSDFIPDRLPFPPTRPSPDSVDVSVGNLTNASAAGDGFLGTAAFPIREGFSNETSIVVSGVVFNLAGGGRQEVAQNVVITVIEKQSSPDFNGSGFVDFEDFIIFAGVYGTRSPEHDLTGDGFVDFEDFIAFARAFGKSVSGKIVGAAKAVVR